MLLHGCNAFEASGHEYGGAFGESNIPKLLVHEVELPHSLRFCRARLRSSFDALGPGTDDEFRTRAVAVLNRLDDLLAGHAPAAPGTGPLSFRDLAPAGRLLREIHDALEQVYVYCPADA